MSEATPSAPAKSGLTWGQLFFMGLLLLVGLAYLGWTAFRSLQAPTAKANLAREARDYLRERLVEPLSGPLVKLVSVPEKDRIRSQAHPLLGEPAPDFTLKDHRGKAWQLDQLLQQGPVVVVFYYGYHCNHCVSQLFELNGDIRYFRELGASVIAISGDPPELTAERFREYGEFAFPVLADPDNRVAQVYGVFQPAQGEKEAVQRHGTFVIGRDGVVEWVNYGNEPFSGNRQLLYRLARLEGRLPR